MLTNYARHLARIAIHFDCIPTAVDTAQINGFLYRLQQEFHSDSYFKFTVFGLRFAYRMEGLIEKHVLLPSIKKEKKLPVVLSRKEIRRLLAAPKLPKHKIILALLYGCGLRSAEARNLKLADLDFDRRMLHIKQGKGKKDRYVPLSRLLIDWISDYLAAEKPQIWLFNGRARKAGSIGPCSQAAIRFAVSQSSKAAAIIKPMSAHTLRHTFATHLLEDGLDIISIKDLLGHSRIETTLVYLHVAHYDRKRPFSPIDTLFGVAVSKAPEHDTANESSRCSLRAHIDTCTDCRSAGLDRIFSPMQVVE